MHYPSKMTLFYVAAITIILFGVIDTSVALAADQSFNIGLSKSNGDFQKMLDTFGKGMVSVAHIVSVIMVALAGCMIVFNVESANKTVWNIILGIGLALNFGTALTGAFGSYVPSGGGTNAAFSYTFHADAATNKKWYDILSPFATMYANYTKAGAAAIMPVAAKLLIVLTTINASVKVSLDLISGDKMKFLTETLLTTGVYLFLIINWYNPNGLNLMGSLMEGFEALGLEAGGASSNLHTNSIIGNAVGMFSTAYGKASDAFSVWSPLSGLATIFCLFVMLILLLLTGLEIFMARIEFYTMAMLTLPLLPFAAIPQTKFLFERAVGAMFNLAIKVSVVTFLEVLCCKILSDYATEFGKIADSKEGIIGNIPVLVQCILTSLILYFIVKKIPELVQGLLSGTPSLGGNDMVATAKNVSNTAAQAGAAVATGGASMAKSAAVGALQGGAAAAGKFKASGSGKFKTAAGAIGGGIAGAANGAAGSMVKGVGGMLKNSIMGSNNNNTGKGAAGSGGASSGGLGLVNAMRQGSQLGKNFSTKNKDGQYEGLFGITTPQKDKNGKNIKTPSIVGNAKQAIKNAISHPEMEKQQRVGQDGVIHTDNVETGRHGGILGSLQDVKQDTQKTFENFKKK